MCIETRFAGLFGTESWRFIIPFSFLLRLHCSMMNRLPYYTKTHLRNMMKVVKTKRFDVNSLQNKPLRFGAFELSYHAPESSTPTSGRLLGGFSASPAAGSTSGSGVGRFGNQIGSAYEDIEGRLMARIGNQNRDRFRLMLSASSVFLLVIAAVFGTDIKKSIGLQASEVAQEALQNEELKVQTGELASAVVQTILNDKDIAKAGGAFVRDTAGTEETQDALLKLTHYVLQHPQSKTELGELVKLVLADLSKDPKTIKDVAVLFSKALTDPEVKTAASQLVGILCVDAAIVQACAKLVTEVVKDEEVKKVSRPLFTILSAIMISCFF